MIKQLTIILSISPFLAFATSQVPGENTHSSSPVPQSVEPKEHESKETEPDDVQASPQELEELKNIAREVAALFAPDDLASQAEIEATIAELLEGLVNRWPNNKITRHIFQAIDAQAPNAEIIKLFKRLPKGIDARDHRALYSIFQTQQEVVSALKQDLELTKAQFNQNPEFNPLNHDAINLASQKTVTLGTRKYTRKEVGSRLNYALHGVTALMKVSAQGNEELLEFLLGNETNFWTTTNLVPWMAKDEAFKFNGAPSEVRIKLKDLFARYLRDTVNGYRIEEEHEGGVSNTVANISALFFERHDALTLAALAGHSNIVDRLLKQLIADHEGKKVVEIIKNALLKLTAFSDPATADCARGLLASLEIVEPKRENYLPIARKLTRAFIEAMPKCRNDIVLQNLYEIKAHKEILNLFVKVMTHGSPEMFEVIAQELAHCDLHPDVMADEAETPGKFVDGHLCGEKLGILFTIDAEKQSLLSIIRRSLLAAAPKNSAFLARLQQFVREHQIMPIVLDEINTYFPRDLSSIVRDYITLHHAPHPSICDHILSWQESPEAVAQLELHREKNDKKQ